jgi:hypothetical protein
MVRIIHSGTISTDGSRSSAESASGDNQFSLSLIENYLQVLRMFLIISSQAKFMEGRGEVFIARLRKKD